MSLYTFKVIYRLYFLWKTLSLFKKNNGLLKQWFSPIRDKITLCLKYILKLILFLKVIFCIWMHKITGISKYFSWFLVCLCKLTLRKIERFSNLNIRKDLLIMQSLLGKFNKLLKFRNNFSYFVELCFNSFSKIILYIFESNLNVK